jgi:hypothetical protein
VFENNLRSFCSNATTRIVKAQECARLLAKVGKRLIVGQILCSNNCGKHAQTKQYVWEGVWVVKLQGSNNHGLGVTLWPLVGGASKGLSLQKWPNPVMANASDAV